MCTKPNTTNHAHIYHKIKCTHKYALTAHTFLLDKCYHSCTNIHTANIIHMFIFHANSHNLDMQFIIKFMNEYKTHTSIL